MRRYEEEFKEEVLALAKEIGVKEAGRWEEMELEPWEEPE